MLRNWLRSTSNWGQAPGQAVTPFTYNDLLSRKKNGQRNELLLHVHLPRNGGNDVTRFLRRNHFQVVDFDFETNDFFSLINKQKWFEYFGRPGVHFKYALTGHYRLSHKIFHELSFPYSIVTVLRHPIDRIISYYNLAQIVPEMAGYAEINSGQFSFTDYAIGILKERGTKQFSYFDNSGTGDHSDQGTSSVEQCLERLKTKVSLFGFNNRFNEFQILVAYFYSLSLVPLERKHNATKTRWPKLDPDNAYNHPIFKLTITPDERLSLEKEFEDEMWFYNEALAEYKRRLNNPALEDALNSMDLVRECQQNLRELASIFPEQ